MPQTSEDFFLQRKKEIISLYSKINLKDILFIGIDRSLSATGISLIKDGKYIKEHEIKGIGYGADRLHYLGFTILNMVLKYKFEYTNVLLMMEDYAFGAKSRSVTGIAEIEGVLQLLFKMKRIDYLHIAPKTAKKYLTGSGNAKKEIMMMYVLKKFGIQSSSNNTADSTTLGFCLYHSFRYYQLQNNNPDLVNKEYTTKEIECFNTVLSLVNERKLKREKKKSKQLALELQDA